MLKQIDGRGGDRTKTADIRGSAPTQRQVAEAAGMSPHQQLQAVRVASVPADEFERQVESPRDVTLFLTPDITRSDFVLAAGD